MGDARNPSLQSSRSPRISGESQRVKVVLYREDQRVSLRAFLRTFLQNEQIAESKAMDEFLTGKPVKLNLEELDDVRRRKDMDKKRIEGQRRFYEVARERARELDIYMERFRRDIIESSMLKDEPLMSIGADKCVDGLTKLFKEIKEKQRIADLSLEFQKFAEWLRIESVLSHQLCFCPKQYLFLSRVAATIYHLFLAEDNSPELLAQAKRIHSMMPYSALKQVIRFANPAMVMNGVLDLFLAQPFGARSLAGFSV